MKYSFQVTANRNVAGKIPKGMTVTVVKDGTATPTPTQILDAYHELHGIEVKGVDVHTNSFDIKKL